MKKLLLFSILCFSTLAESQNIRDATVGDDVFGQTFFSIRPEFQNSSPEKVCLVRDRVKARCDGIEGAWEFVPLGGRSTKANDIMKYFSPYPKNELIVDSLPELTDQTAIERDINPVHFGIRYTLDGTEGGVPTRFKTTLRLRPERSVAGFGISYKQYLGRHCNPCKKWFMEISFPLLYVRNKVRLTETDTTAIGFPVPGSAANMTQAFTGTLDVLNTDERMFFGKINDASTESMKKIGSDIDLKFGTDSCVTDCFHFDGYAGLHFPASNKPKGEFLFEAIPGFNQHFGFIIGGASAVQVWQDCDRSLSWEIETCSYYFVHNTQVRSFDLKNRAWSRYMIVRDADGVLVPGINVFTRKMKVSPRYSFDANTGLVYYIEGKFQAEFGYNFYARQGERVRLLEPFPTGFAIAGIDADNIPLTDAINRLSNIGENNTAGNLPAPGLPGALVNETIQEKDLNLLSAAHPAALSNLLYASIGYQWDHKKYPVLIGFGGFYEISGKNTALSRWLVWGKFCMSV